MAHTVTFIHAFYRNKPIKGTFELVQDYTPWKGENRRVGTAGEGYVKADIGGLAENKSGIAKITVPGPEDGYSIKWDKRMTPNSNGEKSSHAEAQTDKLRTEISNLSEELLHASPDDRPSLRRRINYRQSKLERLEHSVH